MRVPFFILLLALGFLIVSILATHFEVHYTVIGNGNIFVGASLCVPYTPCMEAKG